MKSISKNIAAVLSAFQEGKLFAESESDLEILIGKLGEIASAFPSVLFESASAQLAFQAFSQNENLDNWLLFLSKIKAAYKAQAHVGLGWALAESATSPEIIGSSIENIMRGRVLDGYGYYHGLLRRRLFVKGAKVPENIAGTEMPSFDQGIGRSLCYSSKGNLEMLNKMLLPFAESRKIGLWRGIGLASFYIGGMDAAYLNALLELAGDFRVNLLAGTCLAIKAKVESDSISAAEADLIQSTFKRSSTEFTQLAINSEKNNSGKENAYLAWLEEIETALG